MPALSTELHTPQQKARCCRRLAIKDLGAAHLRSEEVFAGVALQEGPLGGLPLQQVGGQGHLATRHIRPQLLADTPAWVRYMLSRTRRWSCPPWSGVFHRVSSGAHATAEEEFCCIGKPLS